MVVLGIDPGTAVTGYGVVERLPNGSHRLLECGVVRTSPRTPLATRLRQIFEGVSELIDRHAPEVVAVEGAFFGKNARSSLVLGQARGVILLAASMRDIEVAEYPPAEVKSAVVGTGRATKHQVGFMTQKLLKLREPPRPEDAADGVAIAICHCFRSKSGLTGRTPYPPLAGSLR